MLRIDGFGLLKERLDVSILAARSFDPANRFILGVDPNRFVDNGVVPHRVYTVVARLVGVPQIVGQCHALGLRGGHQVARSSAVTPACTTSAAV